MTLKINKSLIILIAIATSVSINILLLTKFFSGQTIQNSKNPTETELNILISKLDNIDVSISNIELKLSSISDETIATKINNSSEQNMRITDTTAIASPNKAVYSLSDSQQNTYNHLMQEIEYSSLDNSITYSQLNEEMETLPKIYQEKLLQQVATKFSQGTLNPKFLSQ